MNSTNNAFFQRNTIGKFDTARTQAIEKVRAKRATSVTNLKHNPTLFQHREVFDSNIYNKVNFFKMGYQ